MTMKPWRWEFETWLMIGFTLVIAAFVVGFAIIVMAKG
jgi:hypothetical protein